MIKYFVQERINNNKIEQLFAVNLYPLYNQNDYKSLIMEKLLVRLMELMTLNNTPIPKDMLNSLKPFIEYCGYTTKEGGL